MKDLVVISGGGSGIGFEIAQSCLAKGWTPLLMGRREKVLESASKKLENCPTLSIDLSKPDSKKILSEHLNSLKDYRIRGVVNNAGIYQPMDLESSDSANWSDQFNINVLSALNLTQACLPYLKKTKGSIVNISSTLGERPIVGAAAYSASKAAMNSLTLSMALEFASDGVRANAVCPGIVNTPIHDQSRDDVSDWKTALEGMQPLGRVGETSDIAPAVIMLLDDSSSWTTGALINIDGGILLKS
jgi:NAD(P)-dependent dehydrogenase (short-subunit alcohol dehydrogenase family)